MLVGFQIQARASEANKLLMTNEVLLSPKDALQALQCSVLLKLSGFSCWILKFFRKSLDKEHAKGSDSNKVEVRMKLSPIDWN